LLFDLSMIPRKRLRVCREGEPPHTFPDHAPHICRDVPDVFLLP
jgi:hypothetical protein